MELMGSFLLGSRSGARTPLKVLVVDMDPKFVREMGAAIRALGGDSLEATTFEAASQLWVAEKPPVLIADVRLGPFNGLQLLLRAKADRPDVVAGITSSVADSVLEVDTKRFGGIFFVKPVEPGHVLKTLLGQEGEVRLERFEERRQGDRRRDINTGVLPDRRLADRRRPKELR
jgi:DNA-binding response OmpR family regulator